MPPAVPAQNLLPEGHPFDKLGGMTMLNEGGMPPHALWFDWFETLVTEFDPSRRPNGGLLPPLRCSRCSRLCVALAAGTAAARTPLLPRDANALAAANSPIGKP